MVFRTIIKLPSLDTEQQEVSERLPFFCNGSGPVSTGSDSDIDDCEVVIASVDKVLWNNGDVSVSNFWPGPLTYASYADHNLQIL